MQHKFWPPSAKTLSTLFVLLCGIAFYFALYHLSTLLAIASEVIRVVSPFVGGVIIAYLLNSPMLFFEKTIFKNIKQKRVLSVITVYLVALIMIAILLNLIVPQVVVSVTELVNNMEGYLSQLNALIQDLSLRFNIELDTLDDVVLSYQYMMDTITYYVTQYADEYMPALLDIGTVVGTGLVATFTAIISSVYMLAGKDRLLTQVKKLTYAIAPTERADAIFRISSRANQIFIGFINGKILDSAIIGMLCFIFTSVLMIPYSVLLSVVVGVTNVIPFYGPFIGAIPGMLLLLIVDPFAALRFGILIIALQQFDGNILGPKILGDSTGLSAIWVLIAIVVGGGLFGFPGMILGVPTFAMIYALTRDWVNDRLAVKASSEFPKEEDNSNQ